MATLVYETVPLGHWGTEIVHYGQSNSAPRGTVSVPFFSEWMGPKSLLSILEPHTLPMDQLFNLEFQFESVFNSEFQPKFGIQLGIPTSMGINLGVCSMLKANPFDC